MARVVIAYVQDGALWRFDTGGTKQGTGGSGGAAYLRTTIMRPAFGDLRAIRTSF